MTPYWLDMRGGVFASEPVGRSDELPCSMYTISSFTYDFAKHIFYVYITKELIHVKSARICSNACNKSLMSTVIIIRHRRIHPISH